MVNRCFKNHILCFNFVKFMIDYIDSLPEDSDVAKTFQKVIEENPNIATTIEKVRLLPNKLDGNPIE